MADTPATTPPPAAAKPSDTKAAASPQDRQAAQKAVDDLKQKLQDAEAKLAATGAYRETTGEEDFKAQQAREQSTQVVVIGRPGGPFSIDGTGFGAQGRQAPPWPGQLLIGGRAVEITSWRDNSIKGTLPADLPDKGDVVLTINDRTLKGPWPAPRTGSSQVMTVRTPDGKLVQGEVVRSTTGPVSVGGAPLPAGNPLPGAQGTGTGGGPDLNPPPGSTGTMTGQQLGAGPTTGAGGGSPSTPVK